MKFYYYWNVLLGVSLSIKILFTNFMVRVQYFCFLCKSHTVHIHFGIQPKRSTVYEWRPERKLSWSRSAFCSGRRKFRLDMFLICTLSGSAFCTSLTSRHLLGDRLVHSPLPYSSWTLSVKSVCISLLPNLCPILVQFPSFFENGFDCVFLVLSHFLLFHLIVLWTGSFVVIHLYQLRYIRVYWTVDWSKSSGHLNPSHLYLKETLRRLLEANVVNWWI